MPVSESELDPTRLKRFHDGMEFSIRTGNLEDARPISRLVSRSATEFILPHFQEEGRRYFLHEHTPAKVRERLSGDFRFFLAEQDLRLIGVAAVRGGSHLYYLFVDATYHRCGVARRLWRHVREALLAADQSGPITVNSSAYAVPVYERFGFERSGPPEQLHGVEHYPMVLKAL